MKNANSPVAHLGVGIDTARYGHHVSFLDEAKRTAAPSFHFAETAQGYQKFQAALDKLARKHPGVHLHIRIDAAGQYAENLLQWLHRLDGNATISVGQPARNKAYRKVHFDKRKADPSESLACARFAVVERPAATPHNPPEFGQVFALWKKDEDFDPHFESRQTQPAESEASQETKTVVDHKKAVKPQGKVVATTASKIPSSAGEHKLRPLHFARLREQITIGQVLEQAGWRRQSARGAQWRGPCPLHESKDATSRCFTAHSQRNVYCCHQCGSEGNALDLWIALCGKPILEAAWDLVETFGLQPPLLGEKEGPPGANP